MEEAKNKFKKLSFLIQDLENNFDSLGVINLKISKNNVGWHLDHCMKVIIEIIKYLEYSDVTAYKKDFNLKEVLYFYLAHCQEEKGKLQKLRSL